MRVAVVTPFCKTRPDWLSQCHASVRAQTHPCTHFLVSDGSGENPLTDFQGQFIHLEQPHKDSGDTPRGIASLSAAAQDFDAIAYLDADDWLLPTHIEQLIMGQQDSGGAICYSGVGFYGTDSRYLGGSSAFPFRSAYVCCMVTRQAFPLLGLWAMMPRAFHTIGDYWMYSTFLRSGLPVADNQVESYAYRTRWPAHYQHFRHAVPTDAKTLEHSNEVDRLIVECKRQQANPLPVSRESQVST